MKIFILNVYLHIGTYNNPLTYFFFLLEEPTNIIVVSGTYQKAFSTFNFFQVYIERL